MNGPSGTQTCIFLTIQIQLDYAMEDFEYTKWLDPDRVPCYIRDTVSK